MKITLSLWDTGGQKRFDFFKSDFFRGCAAIGLVFDLSRPDTFEKVDEYFEEIRNLAGNIPILLVGNKNDLTESLGETISRERIIQKLNQYNLFEYVETSALKNENVVELFNKLSITALMELQPRLGEIVSENHFRFKVLLAGVAAVGKSSLIRTFVKKEFEVDYKITVGLDFMTRDFEIPNDEIPVEVHTIIKEALEKYKTLIKTPTQEKPVLELSVKVETTEISEVVIDSAENDIIIKQSEQEINKKVLTNNHIYLTFIAIFTVLLITIFIHFFFSI